MEIKYRMRLPRTKCCPEWEDFKTEKSLKDRATAYMAEMEERYNDREYMLRKSCLSNRYEIIYLVEYDQKMNKEQNT